MASSIINHTVFEEMFFQQLNESLTEAAEPIVQKAMAEIEIEIRKRLAEHLLARIQSDFSVERMQNDIRIIVHQALPEKRRI